MGSLFQIVYMSTADPGLSEGDLTELLNDSARRNYRMGITGVLLHHDGMFMQVLEGQEADVIALYDKILRDPRHHNIIPLIQEYVEKRLFADSIMTSRASDLPALWERPDIKGFLERPINRELPAKDIPKCLRLLLLFRHNFR